MGDGGRREVEVTDLFWSDARTIPRQEDGQKSEGKEMGWKRARSEAEVRPEVRPDVKWPDGMSWRQQWVEGDKMGIREAR